MARRYEEDFPGREDDWEEQRRRNERRFRSGREGMGQDRWESSERDHDDRERGYYSQQVMGSRDESGWARNRPWDDSRSFNSDDAWNPAARQYRQAGQYSSSYPGESNRYGARGSGYGGSAYGGLYSGGHYGSSGSYGSGDSFTRDYGRSELNARSGNTLRGGFSGKGPRDYTRSDARIREDVCDRLSWDDEVDASDIVVTVSQGEVTLEGTVPDRHSKRRSEDIAEDVMGVKDVHNRLKANKGLMQEVGDKLMGRETESHGHAGSGTRNQPAATSAGSGSSSVSNANHR
jgi:osmotically-inducible protein OsmY